ncbi:MAG TPA: hypothetical protein VIH99_12140, partial [Bdellovibrionota bacterium]
MKFVNTLSIVTLAVAAFSGSARADGFNCQTTDGSLNVKIYNHVQPSEGTRVGSVMVLSDPSVMGGRKTIARFTDVNGRLDSRSSVFTADVDLRYNDSARKGELIMGTKLGFINTITADIDFSYAYPVEDGAALDGKLTILKR